MKTITAVFAALMMAVGAKTYAADAPKRIEIPNDAVLIHHEDMTGYDEGSISGQGNWTASGEALVVSGVNGYSGKVLKIDKANSSAVFSLDSGEQLAAPFIVTADFYNSGFDSNGITYSVLYSNGKEDFVASGIAAINTGDFHLRAEVTGTRFENQYTGVPLSEGWHEFAVKADIDNNITYYIDGQALKSGGEVISQQLPDSVKVSGFKIRAAGWNWTEQTGYATNIRFYKSVIDDFYIKKTDSKFIVTCVGAANSDAKKPIMYTAVYNNEGKMISVTEGTSLGDNIVAEIDAKKYMPGSYKLKAFLWEGESIKPITQAYETEFNVSQSEYYDGNYEKVYADQWSVANEELSVYDKDVSSYKKEISETNDLNEVYGILDRASSELGAKTITLPYGQSTSLHDLEVLFNAFSIDGIRLGDDNVIEYTENSLKAVGIGRAIVRSDDQLYLVKVVKAPMALVLISGQSNSAGASSDYRLAPSAVGKYKNRYMITNCRDCTLPVEDITWEEAVYCAENGGRRRMNYVSTGAASQLGACLSDEWDMPVWVVNTGVGGQIIEAFDPKGSNPVTYNATVNYVNKVKSVIAEEGHYEIDEDKMGLFWIQGCSDGINMGVHTNTMEEYTEMFTNMYEGWKEEIGIRYAGIWMVRAGTYQNNDAVAFYMSGPRLSQFYMTNSSDEKYKDVYLIFNTDVWRTDESVDSYFTEKYSDPEVFRSYYGYELPNKWQEIKPDIHYNQKGYNELGDVAGDVIADILSDNIEQVESAELFSYEGTSIPVDEGISLRVDEDAVAVPVVTNVLYNASYNVTVTSNDESVAVYDNDTYTLHGISMGNTVLEIRRADTLLATYPVSVSGLEEIQVEGINIPEGAELVENEDCSSSDGWTLGSGFGFIETAYGYNCDAIKGGSVNHSANFTLENAVDKNAIVTMKFYSENLGHSFAPCFTYSDGEIAAVAGNIINVNNGLYAFIGRGNNRNYGANSSQITQSVGWHEFAAAIDANGNVTYYIDGEKVTKGMEEFNDILPDGVTLNGVGAKVFGWNSYITGAITDIKVYMLKTE